MILDARGGRPSAKRQRAEEDTKAEENKAEDDERGDQEERELGATKTQNPQR